MWIDCKDWQTKCGKETNAMKQSRLDRNAPFEYLKHSIWCQNGQSEIIDFLFENKTEFEKYKSSTIVCNKN